MVILSLAIYDSDKESHARAIYQLRPAPPDRIDTAYYHWTSVWPTHGHCELNSQPIVSKKIAKLQGDIIECFCEFRYFLMRVNCIQNVKRCVFVDFSMPISLRHFRILTKILLKKDTAS